MGLRPRSRASRADGAPLLKRPLIQAIINPRPQSSLYLIEAGRKSKKVTIIGLSHNNKVKQIQEHQHIGYILRTFK